MEKLQSEQVHHVHKANSFCLLSMVFQVSNEVLHWYQYHFKVTGIIFKRYPQKEGTSRSIHGHSP